MTTISNRHKNKTEGKKYLLEKREYIIMAIYGIAGFTSGYARWCDVALPAVAVILAHITRDTLYKYSVIAGALVTFGALGLKDTAYIPYFVGVVVYATVLKTLKKPKYSLLAAMGFMAVSKIILVCYYMPFYTKLLAVAEAAAVYIISQTIAIDEKITAGNKNALNLTDSTIYLLALLTVVLGFSGADSHWLYPGFAIALGLAWRRISQGRLTTAFVALVAAAVSLADKKGFGILLLAAAVLWLIGGFFAEKLSLVIYPAVLSAAFICNLIFIGRLNGFALTGSSVLALIVYFFAPYMATEQAEQIPSLAAGRDWRLLMLSLKKLENTLSFLGGCVIDISRLNEKNLKTEKLEDIVAEEVCRKCEKNTICWQQKYSFTQQRFTDYARKMYWREENRFPIGFYSQCVKTEGLIKSFEENSRLLLSKKYILQSQKNNQKLLQKTFTSMAEVVSDIVYQNQHSYLLNNTITMETERFLNELEAGHTYCLCSQNPDHVTFAVYNPLEEKTVYKIKCHIEKLYGTKFLEPYVEKQGSELLYLFVARPLFDYDIAVKNSRYKNVNGDTQDVFVHNGALYVLLSDGMGTGNMAAAESRTVIAMARSLIVTGASMRTVIDLTNLSLNLKGSGETSASLDILRADLFTGNCTITKAGAGVTVVIDKNGVSRHYGDSLPLGIVKEVRPVRCEFTVKTGDTIVMMSDGVGVVSQDIKDMYGESCEKIAQTVLSRNITDDDKTVVAVKLKPTG